MLKDNENDLVIENFESEENRITGTTRKNTESSRSTALIKIKYFKNEKEAGRFNFINLFGSEDISTEKYNGTKDDKSTRESIYSS